MTPWYLPALRSISLRPSERGPAVRLSRAFSPESLNDDARPDSGDLKAFPIQFHLQQKNM
jgi:hypothetical protein